MSSDLVRFTVAVPRDLLGKFDQLVERRGVMTNRSEAIRDLIREKLVKEELEEPNAEVVGSITMVYDHHLPGISQRLDEIQHEHLDVVVSKMHVHLDHGACLETIAVRGSSDGVHALADKLLGTKGVRHGKLVCVAAESGHDHCHDHHHE